MRRAFAPLAITGTLAGVAAKRATGRVEVEAPATGQPSSFDVSSKSPNGPATTTATGTRSRFPVRLACVECASGFQMDLSKPEVCPKWYQSPKEVHIKMADHLSKSGCRVEAPTSSHEAVEHVSNTL